MNNSKIALDNQTLREDEPRDISPYLREKERELVETIEALQEISQSSYWKTLEINLFNGLLESIDTRLRVEKDERELYRLQGKAEWCAKYCNFGSLIEEKRKELQVIQKQLKVNL